MLSPQELKDKLIKILDKIEINEKRLAQFSADFSKVNFSLNKANSHHPAKYSYLLPYQQSNLPKGTTAKINRYITTYVSHMSLAKDFFSTIYVCVQDDLANLPSLIEEIESTMRERIRLIESRNSYLKKTCSCEEENAVLSQICDIKKYYKQLCIDFAEYSFWILEFLYKDLEQSKKEYVSKTYFSRIHMRLAPNSENDDLAQFNDVYKQILQKYLTHDVSAASENNDKLSMRHITDLAKEDVELLLQDLAMAMDKIVFDKENACPAQPVSGLVANLS